MKKSKRQTVITSYDKKEKLKIPIVKSPSRIIDKRLGKGFSIKEIKAATIPLSEFNRLNLKIDYRRRTIYDSNVEFLGRKYRELLSEEIIEREALEKLEKREKEIIKNLIKIPSISKKIAKRLVNTGVKSIEDLMKEDASSLAIDIGEKEKIVNQWIKDSKKFKDLLALDGAINNLCQIDILNKEKARQMASIGIVNLEILAEEDPLILADDLGVSEYLAKEWIKKANQLSKKDIKIKKTTKKEKEVKKREEPLAKVSKKVKTKPKELSLKDIGGIGKNDLKKLEALEITTLKQLAEEDPLEISSIVGVGKDQVLKWINSARELLGMPRIEEIKKKKKVPTVKKIEE
ncbi:MAG: helix-hairpin-helix domain-containing protein, partial [Candidatus Hodarchaeota archaeon]